jgi:fructan beta-fructosidase
MTLATLDHITFFSSSNLKSWKKESEFGKALGAHGGVWECPDLFPLTLAGKTYWVLIVNLNPGGPNGGSATQYFVGQFDGNKFNPLDNNTRWMDYGPDEYAGITWSNTGSRKIFLGWMSNWVYANQVPTEKWRNAMTIPRELALKKISGYILVTSKPVKELAKLALKPILVSSTFTKTPEQYILEFNQSKIDDYKIILSNDLGEQLLIGYDKNKKGYYIDRSKSGKVDFNPEFAKIAYAPRVTNAEKTDVRLVVDKSSIELFADGGASVMTSIFFPSKPFNHINLKSVNQYTIIPLKSIW